MTHPNSLQAFTDTQIERMKRRAEVLGCFKKADRPLSDREVLQMLGKTDPNYVRPRISELVDEGELFEVGKVKDILTGRTVRVCEATRQMRLF